MGAASALGLCPPAGQEPEWRGTCPQTGPACAPTCFTQSPTCSVTVGSQNRQPALSADISCFKIPGKWENYLSKKPSRQLLRGGRISLQFLLHFRDKTWNVGKV